MHRISEFAVYLGAFAEARVRHAKVAAGGAGRGEGCFYSRCIREDGGRVEERKGDNYPR